MRATWKICVFLLAPLLGGCSFNPVGESTFDCNRKSNPSEYCRSFKALEKSTKGPLPESRFDREFRMSDHDRATGIAPVVNEENAKDPNPGPLVVFPHNRQPGERLAHPIPGTPVRKSPVIQRVWIKPFVDENDSLQGEVIVYKEIQSSKWSGYESTATNSSGGGASRSIYPHKPRDDEADASQPASSVNHAKNFSQPEAKADGAIGTATPPAEIGGTSMP